MYKKIKCFLHQDFLTFFFIFLKEEYLCTFAFQIVSKGNDQVAMSSKFETREDPGKK